MSAVPHLIRSRAGSGPQAGRIGSRCVSLPAGAIEVHAHGNEVERTRAAVGQAVPRLATIRDANVEPGYPKIVQIFLNRWEKLSSDDPRNVPLTAVVSMFGLTDHEKRSLISAGTRIFGGLARAVNAAPRIERLNARMKEFSSTLANELPRNRMWFTVRQKKKANQRRSRGLSL